MRNIGQTLARTWDKRLTLLSAALLPLSNSENEYTLENSKAFRYVYVTHEPGVQIGEVSMQYEYLPEEYRGNFRCNDEELNRIWEVGAYTMHLTTREFFI